MTTTDEIAMYIEERKNFHGMANTLDLKKRKI
jgi:hypothetical protein